MTDQAQSLDTAISPQAFHLISRAELAHLVQTEGKSDADIAKLYRVSTNQVNAKRRQMNLLDGQMTSAELAEAVRLGEAIKHLPREALAEIKEIVARYTKTPPLM